MAKVYLAHSPVSKTGCDSVGSRRQSQHDILPDCLPERNKPLLEASQARNFIFVLNEETSLFLEKSDQYTL